MTSGKVLKAGQESGGHATTLRLPACGGEKARPEGQRPKDLAGVQVWFADGRLALAAAASAPDATGPGRPKKIDPKLHGRTPDAVGGHPEGRGIKSSARTGRLIPITLSVVSGVNGIPPSAACGTTRGTGKPRKRRHAQSCPRASPCGTTRGTGKPRKRRHAQSCPRASPCGTTRGTGKPRKSPAGRFTDASVPAGSGKNPRRIRDGRSPTRRRLASSGSTSRAFQPGPFAEWRGACPHRAGSGRAAGDTRALRLRLAPPRGAAIGAAPNARRSSPRAPGEAFCGVARMVEGAPCRVRGIGARKVWRRQDNLPPRRESQPGQGGPGAQKVRRQRHMRAD